VEHEGGSDIPLENNEKPRLSIFPDSNSSRNISVPDQGNKQEEYRKNHTDYRFLSEEEVKTMLKKENTALAGYLQEYF
jgi:hypothetical protein